MSPAPTTIATKEADKATHNANDLAALVDHIEDPDEATALLTDVQANIRTLEQKRKKITKPLLEAKREVDALFKPPIKILEDAKMALKRIIAKAIDERRAEQHAALQAGDVDGALAVKEPEASSKTVTRYRVVDENKVPRKYWKLDDAKIKKAVEDGETEIPGVEVYEETVVIAR